MYSPYLASTTNFPFGIEVDRAEGTFIYDTKGKRYFDLIAGISVSNLGHQHPQIIREIKRQIDKHLHVMVFGEYSRLLAVVISTILLFATKGKQYS